MKLIQKTACVSACLAVGIVLACERSERLAGPEANVVLPARSGDVDTSRLIKKFRDRGAGNVFIVLTGEPSAAALAELGTAGVQAPLGRPGIVTFDSLKIATVWGYVTARDVRSVALIPYVVRIESSEDERTILPHASNPPVDAGATDIGWNLLRVRAPDLWRDFDATGQRQLSPTGWQSAGVAVLDDGGDYRLRYPAQNWQFFTAYATSPGNFTTDTTQIYLGQHGTDVGSLIAGEPNGLWGVGVAPRAAVAFSKVLPSADDWGPIVQGLNQAYTDGPAVVNMGFGNCGDLPPSTVQTAISRFTTRVPADAANPGVGVSLVASAGNGTLTSPTPCPTTAVSYPAAYSEVIAVAAIDQNNATMQGFSVGPDVELSAPGICVNGLLVGGGDHPCLTGTSFAAAHVAGLIAAIRATNNTWSAAFVRGRLQETATKIAGQTLPRDNRFGYGLINAYTAVQDTTRPPLPGQPNLPQDSTFTVEAPDLPRSEILYYRNIVGIIFDDTTSGATVRALLARYGGSILGGGPGVSEYIVQIPDPGSTFAAVDGKVTQLNSESGVALARKVYYRTPVYLDGRYPNDGPGSQRGDWAAPTNATRALLQIRAPLGWGCETGAYTAARLGVGVIDFMFDSLHPDLVSVPWLPPAPATPRPPHPLLASDPGYRGHGTAVVGILAARADNGTGIAGMVWESNLTTYSLSRDQAFDEDLVGVLDRQIDDALAKGVRLIAMSVGFGRVGDATDVARLRLSLERYLRSGGMLVLSAGERQGGIGLRMTIAQLGQTQVGGLGATKSAAAQLYAGGYADRIIWVAGTDNAGAFWQPSNFWTGATLVAPGTSILTLSNTADGHSTDVWQGTSFSTPYVAGLAGLLWAADPTLVASQVKDYILRGELEPRLDRQTGQIAAPPPVTGAPETVYQLDAYGSLQRLAAERQNVPLCGNRVWVAGTQLVAQRDTNTAPQVLANLGEPAAFVNVHHGGRRVDVWNNDFVQRSFLFDQGAWTESTNPPASPDGGAWNSLWSLSHDGDSAVTVQVTGANGSSFEVRRGPTGGASTHLADITVPLSSSQAYTCLWVSNDTGVCGDSVFTGYGESASSNAAAYSPLGDRVIVMITKRSHQSTNVSGYSPCPWGPAEAQCRTIDYLDQTIGTTFYQVDLHNGTQSALATAQVEVWWGALAEDGGQLVTGESTWSETSTMHPTTNGSFKYVVDAAPPVIGACTLRYRQASSGMPSRFATASDDVCRGPLGGGSVAPAPPISRRSE